MYHRGRKKMRHMIIVAVLLLSYPAYTLHKSITTHKPDRLIDDNIDNTIIDFEEDYTVKFNKKYGIPWNPDDYFNKELHRYTIVKDHDNKLDVKGNKSRIDEETTVDYSVIPLELISTTENVFSSVDFKVEDDLTVIPLTTTERLPDIKFKQTVVLPSSTEQAETTTDSVVTEIFDTTSTEQPNVTQSPIIKSFNTKNSAETKENVTQISVTEKYTTEIEQTTLDTTTEYMEVETTFTPINDTDWDDKRSLDETTVTPLNITDSDSNNKTVVEATNTTIITLNSTTIKDNINRSDTSSTEESDVPIFTELDTEELPDVPEDYYDTKDVVPTSAPKTDALSVIFGLAGSMVESVVESVAERVVPKSIFDLFKRMQRQNEALEAERLRSREENGGLGQFGRGILKSISSGISKPLSQLMAGVRDIGSLDSDKGFVSSLASGVTNVANSVVDTFKDRVQAIYPGTVWCGDGRSATARSSDLGLFFFTDTCCRQHDACKLYIKAGETKYGLTNTGLFTRSHCSCDAKFRECLMRTNSLVSAQIGLTYFNVLGPQCFRRAHPIVRCVRRTRITGQKCEEYELDYTKPRMWQWFDNETF